MVEGLSQTPFGCKIHNVENIKKLDPPPNKIFFLFFWEFERITEF